MSCYISSYGLQEEKAMYIDVYLLSYFGLHLQNSLLIVVFHS
jgi:hypothetical protein